jgi:mannose-6-phosphate isomerase-like protein (cupin superfamily)
MEITVDESEPEDSIDRYVMDTVCTGEEALKIPPHWHKVSEDRCKPSVSFMANTYEYVQNHQEYLGVVEGRVKITLNGKTSIMNAGDPAVLVPRRAVHSVEGFKGEKLIFREKPDPAGICKAL